MALVDDGHICRALLAAKADPYKTDEKFGQTALHVAATRGCVNVIQELVAWDRNNPQAARNSQYNKANQNVKSLGYIRDAEDRTALLDILF